jgi:hypothetical protein
MPTPILWLAGACCLLSLFGAVWLSGKQAHSPRGRLGWILLCGVVGLPALVSLWLLYPRREVLLATAAPTTPAGTHAASGA